MDLKWEGIIMKCFMNDIDKDTVVGFDLDGTIYDEFEFIAQAYISIAEIISYKLNMEKSCIYERLCMEWLRYGSSFNIFQKVIGEELSNQNPQLIKECIRSYRKTNFKLKLSVRAEIILETLVKTGCELFIVTDGDRELQRKKIDALGLMRWFTPNNIAISGDYGRDVQKPSTYMATKISALKTPKKKVMFLGDRYVDWQFANNCGFEFYKIKNMIECG